MFVLFGYYDYEGIVFDEGEKVCFVCDFGSNMNLMLCNYGLLIVGVMLVDVFVVMYFFEVVCMI